MQLVFDHVLTACGDDGQSAYNRNIDVNFARQSPAVKNSGLLDGVLIEDDVVA